MASINECDAVILRVICNNSSVHMFSLEKSKQLKQLFIGLSQKLNIPVDAIHMQYKGHKIQTTDTAQSLKLSDCDIVHVSYLESAAPNQLNDSQESKFRPIKIEQQEELIMEPWQKAIFENQPRVSLYRLKIVEQVLTIEENNTMVPRATKRKLPLQGIFYKINRLIRSKKLPKPVSNGRLANIKKNAENAIKCLKRKSNIRLTHRKKITDLKAAQNKEISDLSETNTKMMKLHQIEIAKLKDFYRKKLTNLVDNYKRKKKSHFDSMEQMKNVHCHEIETLKHIHEKTLNQALTIYTNDKNHLSKVHAEAIKQLVDEHRSEVISSEMNYRQALERLEVFRTDYLNIDNSMKREMINQKKVHFNNIEKMLKSHEKKRLMDMEELEQTVSNQLKNAHSHKVKCLENEIRNLNKCCEELQQSKKQYEIEALYLIAETKTESEKQAKKQQQIQANYEKTKNQLEKIYINSAQHESLLTSLTATHKKEIKILKDQLKIAHSRADDLEQHNILCESKIMKLNNKMDKLKSKSVSTQIDHKKQLEEQSDKYDVMVKTLKENHIRTIAKIRQQHETDKIALKKNNSIEQETLLLSLKNEYSKEIDILKGQSNSESIQTEYLKEIDLLKSKLQSEYLKAGHFQQMYAQSLSDNKTLNKQMIEIVNVKNYNENQIEQLKAMLIAAEQRTGLVRNECEIIKSQNKISNELRELAHHNEIARMKEMHDENLANLRQTLHRNNNPWI